MDSTRVLLYRTSAEWEAVKKRVPKRNFNSFVRSEIKKIVQKYNECPLCVTPAQGVEVDGEKKRKEILIDNESYVILKTIANSMQKPVAAVIDEFIIVPLLMP